MRRGDAFVDSAQTRRSDQNRPEGAIGLAKLHRAGELTSVWVPDPSHEAIRDLVLARLAVVRATRQARQQLSGFLLRHGHHYNRPRLADWSLAPVVKALQALGGAGWPD
jgi:transposase